MKTIYFFLLAIFFCSFSYTQENSHSEMKNDTLYKIITGKSSAVVTAQINELDFIELYQSDWVRMLDGKIPGVAITSHNSLSGSATSITIRGVQSFIDHHEPLIIVDGVPLNTQTNFVSIFSNSYAHVSSRSIDIDPNNIASIKVLKSLASTNIYGSEGRNGVILISTKTNDF